jgi:hypothetical protein
MGYVRELGFPKLGPMNLYEDWRAVIAMAENPGNRKGGEKFAGPRLPRGSVKKTMATPWLACARLGARHRGRGQDHEDGAHIVDWRRPARVG